MQKIIYFDNGATTKIAPEVLKEMQPYLTSKYANASSQYSLAEQSAQAIKKSREKIAKSIHAKPEEIIFTSGGTESNNFALKGLWFKQQESKTEKNHIITTKIEHDSILNVCKWLETQGAKITYLNVDKHGFINSEDIKNAITPKTFLVSIIHANNEIGTIQDMEKIGQICKEKNILFHTDACQSFTKTYLDVKEMNLDLVSLNAHKIHGPKGIGALYIKKGTQITPLQHGGGHEFKLRSGTENVPAITGFGKATEIISEKDIENIEKLQKYLINELLKIPKVELNGPPLGEHRLCNNINVTFTNIEGESILYLLEMGGICTSTGSACMSNTLEPSHVLNAIGISHLKSNASLRITISKYTTKEEIDEFLQVIPGIVQKLRAMSPITQKEEEEN